MLTCFDELLVLVLPLDLLLLDALLLLLPQAATAATAATATNGSTKPRPEVLRQRVIVSEIAV
jgi:hypothetical protein